MTAMTSEARSLWSAIFSRLATAAFQESFAGQLFRFRQVGEIDVPEVDGAVQKRDAIDVGIAFRADLADDAGLDLLVGRLAAHDEFLFGGELVGRDNPRAMAAEDDGFGPLGEDAAFPIASEQIDSDLLGNASTATCAVGHKSEPLVEGGELGPIEIELAAIVAQ